jgi:hypothetical protein
MTVVQDPQSPKHEMGTFGALTDMGGRLLSTLPAGFLLLVLLNCGFLGLVLWFLDDQLDQRTKLVGQLLDHCLDIAKGH